METIHPNNIQDLDTDVISFITLKNGNMIMVDDSAPEKPKKEKSKLDNNSKNEKIPQPLEVSNELTISFKGKENNNNKNLSTLNDIINNNEKKIVVKSDFNLISHIENNTHFSFAGNPRQNIINNIPVIPDNKNENLLLNTNNDNNINIPQSINNFSPIVSSNENNIKSNLGKNALIDKTKMSNYDDNNTSSNKGVNSNDEENKEEGNISSRVRRKSRNYMDKIGKLMEDINKPTIKAVISLNIPSDVQKNISNTQKQFDLLVTQLRQKQNKYRRNKNTLNYPKYYEFYKNNKINEILSPKVNRIKYYQESEKEDLENDILFNGNDNLRKSLNINNNIKINTSNNKSFYDGFNNKTINVNKSVNYNMRSSSIDFNKSINNFYIGKNTSMNNSKLFSKKQGGNILGISSSLVYPSNRCKSKINSFY